MSSIIAQQFSLRWDDFSVNMKSEFHALLESEDLVDVTLAIDGHFIQAHKVVLSASSPYFKSLFKLNPCKHPVIILKGVEHRELLNLLQFIYKGEVNISQDELPAFIKTAELLQLKGLANEEEMGRNLTGNGKENAEENSFESFHVQQGLSTKRVRVEKSPCVTCKSDSEGLPCASTFSSLERDSDRLDTSIASNGDASSNYYEDILHSEEPANADEDIDIKPSPEFLAMFEAEVGQQSQNSGVGEEDPLGCHTLFLPNKEEEQPIGGTSQELDSNISHLQTIQRLPQKRSKLKKKSRNDFNNGKLQNKRHKKQKSTSSAVEERLNGRKHHILKNPLKKYKDCAVCSNRLIKGGRRQTPFICKTCPLNPGLHPGDCFKRYHTMVRYKYVSV